MKQSKSAGRGLQMILTALLFVTVLLPIQKVGLVSNLGNESVYWERARFLLGQGGASLYDGSSLASLGYSLVLAPVCALVKSPYAAYKAAILLNGIFLCGSYLISCLTAAKLFPREKKNLLFAACFFVAACPAFATGKVFTGPAMISMFLAWCIVYLLTVIWEKYEKRHMIFLAVCLILLGFFQISLFGVILGTLLVLAIYVKQKKVEEHAFLLLILAVLLGLAAGNIAERMVLWRLAAEDVTVLSSFEVLINGITAGWNRGYLGSLFNSAAGKLYSAMIGSFLLVCPGLWLLLRKTAAWVKSSKKLSCEDAADSRTYEMEAVFTGIFVLFAVQLILISLYDHSRSAGTGLTSISGLLAVLPPVILLGIMQIKTSKCWTKELTGYLLALCVCAFLTANVYQTEGVGSISAVNNGILMVFQAGGQKPVPLTYTAACMAILAAILLWGCVRGDTKKKRLNQMLRGGGVLLGVLLCGYFHFRVFESVARVLYENSMNSIAPAAAVISDTKQESGIYYLLGSGSDQGIAVLQSLLPDKEITLIENDGKEKELFYEEINENPENSIIITGTGASVLEELREDKIPGFSLMYMTNQYSLWAPYESPLYEELETVISGHVEYLEEEKTEEEAAEQQQAEEELNAEQTETLKDGDSEEDPDQGMEEDTKESAGESEEENVQEEALTENEDQNAALSQEETGDEADESGEDALTAQETETDEAGIAGIQENGEDGSQTEMMSETETESETLEETETESSNDGKTTLKKTYGGDVLLAPGTYRLEVYFQDGQTGHDLSGEVTVRDDDGEVLTKAFPGDVFDEEGNGSVGLEFTSEEVRRNLTVEITGNAASYAKTREVYCWKLTASYMEGMNREDALALVSDAVKDLDEAAGTQGCVAYLTEETYVSQNISLEYVKEWLPEYEVLPVDSEREAAGEITAEYLVGATEGHPYYDLMDDYSIMKRTETYTVLVRNDSRQYRTFEELGGEILSEGKALRMTAFSEETVEEKDKIALESGSFRYHMLVEYDAADLFGTEDAAAATIKVYNGKTLVGQKAVTNGELLAGTVGEAGTAGAEVEVPFALRLTTKKLNFKVELDSARDLTVTARSIELAADKYQFGQEESMLQPYFDMINRMGTDVKLCAALTEETYDAGLYGFDYLQEQLPDCEVSAYAYNDVYSLTEDTLVLTRGFNKSYLKLLSRYTIIGHAMQYTLWVRSDGELLQRAVRAGATVYSSEKKISPDSIALASGEYTKENVIGSLPKGKYKVTLEVTAPDLKTDDTVDVILLRDKTDGEIQAEADVLMEEGYTKKEALEEIDRQEECGSVSVDAWRFDGADSALITVSMDGEVKPSNLTFDIYSWHGAEVKGKIVWVEME